MGWGTASVLSEFEWLPGIRALVRHDNFRLFQSTVYICASGQHCVSFSSKVTSLWLCISHWRSFELCHVNKRDTYYHHNIWLITYTYTTKDYLHINQAQKSERGTTLGYYWHLPYSCWIQKALCTLNQEQNLDDSEIITVHYSQQSNINITHSNNHSQ